MRVRGIAGGVLLAAVLAQAGAAQQSVDVRRTASATGTVEIHVPTGQVRVVGWNRDEVHVRGQLGTGSDRVDVSSAGGRVVVRVSQHRRSGRAGDTNLEIRYPARSAVEVGTVSADVDVRSAGGRVKANGVSGNVTVDGNPAELEVSSRSGDLRLSGGTGRLRFNSVSGNLDVSGPVRGEVEVNTVSGDVHLGGAVGALRVHAVSGDVNAPRLEGSATVQTVSGDVQLASRALRGDFTTVSGTLTLSGAPDPGRTLKVQSHSGEIVLRFPRGVNAEVGVTTWSGEVMVEVGGAQLTSASRRERQIRLGRGGARVEVSTFSGDVLLTHP